jgi:4'-phosphopantetheinyl transferase
MQAVRYLREAESSAGSAACWVVGLSRIPEPVEALQLLSPEEQARAARFRRRVDRDRFAASHAALRLILARHLHGSPASLVFREGENGRPLLAGESLDFNLSHSGDLALIAVSTVPIGVDVEQIKEMTDFLAIARRYFAAAELEFLRKTPPEELLKTFYAIWTRKEAFVKATGRGLNFPLNDFAVVAPDSMAGWTIADLMPAEGYAGAVVVAKPDISIRCVHAEWTELSAMLSSAGR